MEKLFARLFGRYQSINIRELSSATRVGGYWRGGKFYVTKIEPNPQ